MVLRFLYNTYATIADPKGAFFLSVALWFLASPLWSISYFLAAVITWPFLKDKFKPKDLKISELLFKIDSNFEKYKWDKNSKIEECISSNSYMAAQIIIIIGNLKFDKRLENYLAIYLTAYMIVTYVKSFLSKIKTEEELWSKALQINKKVHNDILFHHKGIDTKLKEELRKKSPNILDKFFKIKDNKTDEFVNCSYNIIEEFVSKYHSLNTNTFDVNFLLQYMHIHFNEGLKKRLHHRKSFDNLH